ncbi:MAG: tetratricopeptide repeat protein [Pyrinomonadaceae bacterium]
MLFEKTKVVRSAEKYLALGKIPEAIKEYEQLVANDLEDLTALNMLGDLYVRVGNKEQAMTCFVRIAEHYREADFALKAIAMYKKIERLRPRDPEVAEKLAALYGMQGLIVEARAQYLIVADAYTRAGESRKALEVLRNIADLDPENTDIRIKLAEGYLKEGVTSEAAAAFVVAGEHLVARGAADAAVEAYTRAQGIQPNDQAVLNGILAAQAARGTADEAVEIIERAVAENPDEPALLEILARAYIAAEDAAGAERVTAELAAKDPDSYLRFVEVAHLHLNSGNLDGAVSVAARIVEQMLAAREEVALLELVNEVLARDPEHVQGLRLLVRIHWWQRDMDKLRAALERLLEAAEAAGLVEDERYALTQLTRLVPDQPGYFARLQELGGEVEEASAEALPDFQSAAEGIPTFEGAAIGGEASEFSEAVESSQAVAFEWNRVEDAPAPDPSASFADLDQTSTATDDSATIKGDTEVEATGSGFQEISFETAGPEALPSDHDLKKSPDVDRETMFRQELESVDFYINQGYADIALDTLELLERQFGSHDDIDVRRDLLKSTAAPAAVGGVDKAQAKEPADAVPFAQVEIETTPPPAPTPFVPAEALPAEKAPEPVMSSPAPVIDPGLADLIEEFRVAADDEEPRPTEADYETHYNLGLAYKDLYMPDEAVEEFQVAAGLVRPGDGTARYLNCCNMLGHCFLQKGLPRLAVMWFKKGLNSPGHSEEEYQALRYDLGSAYEEMGNLDQAIDVFSEVYGVNISYRGVAKKLRQLQERKSAEKQETPATR